MEIIEGIVVILFRNLEFIQPKPVSEKSDAIAQLAELNKSPVVAEFLGLKQDFHYFESELLAQLDRLLEV